MKKLIVYLLLSMVTGISSAQWTTLNSTTTTDLHDVDFLNPFYGVITGDAGTILLTTNGGTNWSSINNGSITGPVMSVRIMNIDTILVSTYNVNNVSATVHRTMNGGASWSPVTTQQSVVHKMDLEKSSPVRLFGGGSSIQLTDNNGTSWTTTLSNIGGTVLLDLLRFADPQVGHYSGLISGFATYSAYFYRSEDSGYSWFYGDPFSFPNADALTTMCFTDPDTAFVFMNHYSGFVPSAQNALIRIYGFNKASQFPGDTMYTFTSQIIQPSMPAYMNDAFFIDSQNGYAAGNNGNVYHTVNGGATWVNDYITGSPLFTFSHVGGTAYAVGDNGKLIKNAGITGMNEQQKETAVKIFPVPAHDHVSVVLREASSVTKMEIINAAGSIVKTLERPGAEKSAAWQIDLEGLSAGYYSVRLTGQAFTIYRKLVKL